jgi:hypothetical protein
MFFFSFLFFILFSRLGCESQIDGDGRSKRRYKKKKKTGGKSQRRRRTFCELSLVIVEREWKKTKEEEEEELEKIDSQIDRLERRPPLFV